MTCFCVAKPFSIRQIPFPARNRNVNQAALSRSLLPLFHPFPQSPVESVHVCVTCRLVLEDKRQLQTQHTERESGEGRCTEQREGPSPGTRAERATLLAYV